MSSDLKFSLFTTIVVLALIVAACFLGPLLPWLPLALIVTFPAKIFCQFVNFSFFVIDVMLSASLFCVTT